MRDIFGLLWGYFGKTVLSAVLVSIMLSVLYIIDFHLIQQFEYFLTAETLFTFHSILGLFSGTMLILGYVYFLHLHEDLNINTAQPGNIIFFWANKTVISGTIALALKFFPTFLSSILPVIGIDSISPDLMRNFTSIFYYLPALIFIKLAKDGAGADFPAIVRASIHSIMEFLQVHLREGAIVIGIFRGMLPLIIVLAVVDSLLYITTIL